MGSVRLTQPISSKLITTVAAAIAIGLLLFLWLGSFAKKAHVSGIVLPEGGTISIAAPTVGVIAKTYVKENELVNEGQILFELSTERRIEQGDVTQVVSQNLEARLNSLKLEQQSKLLMQKQHKAELLKRIENQDAEVQLIDREIALAKQRHVLADESLVKFKQLQSSGYVSDLQMQQKSEDSIDASSKLANLERQRSELSANRLAILSDLTSLDGNTRNEQSEFDRSIAEIQQQLAENTAKKSVFVRSPRSGSIAALAQQPGQAVGSGQILATLIPYTKGSRGNELLPPKLEVNLYASSRMAGFVKPNQIVLINYQAFPYQKFGLHEGTVVDISSTPLSNGELPVNFASTILSNLQHEGNGENSNENLYRIRVRLNSQTLNGYGEITSIKPGMTVDADIIQDKRRIWEWILDPIMAMKKNFR
jgi:membrane fusion protein